MSLISDTVGFIQKLPTTLVAAFRATLEEIAEASLLLHVLDINHVNVRAQAEAVHQTLEEIKASHIPVLTVLNKIDQLPNPAAAHLALEGFPNAVAVSAITGEGITDLIATIQQQLYEQYIFLDIHLPYKEGKLISLFHDQGQIERVEHTNGGVQIAGRMPGRYAAQFAAYQLENQDPLEAGQA